MSPRVTRSRCRACGPRWGRRIARAGLAAAPRLPLQPWLYPIVEDGGESNGTPLAWTPQDRGRLRDSSLRGWSLVVWWSGRVRRIPLDQIAVTGDTSATPRCCRLRWILRIGALDDSWKMSLTVLRRIQFYHDSSGHSDDHTSHIIVADSAIWQRVRPASGSRNETLGSVAIDDGTPSRSRVDRIDGHECHVTPWTFDRDRPWRRSATTGRRAGFLFSLSARILRLRPRGESVWPRLAIETPVTRFDGTDRVSGR
jgi:hypothetical protein